MPGIRATFAQYDLDLLQRIARAWDVEISTRDVDTAREDLALQLVLPQVYQAFIDALPLDVREAWETLARRGGKQTWAEFSRLNGEIRSFGPAKRAREEPDLHPVSIAEVLWYAGLLGRAFLRSTGEPVEHVYIPDELMPAVAPDDTQKQLLIRPAVNQSPRFITHADQALTDQLTDVLAALRMQREIPAEIFAGWGKPREFMRGLLFACDLIDPQGQPVPQALKSFFGTPRGQLLLQLYQAWLNTRAINELRLMPDIKCEGNWENDPLAARLTLTGVLKGLDTNTWWSISSLLSAIKEISPDFQRPAGDYDSWFIRDKESDAFLHGFSSWQRVEGGLLYYLLTGPLHWLGLIHLARGSADGRYTAFQLVDQTHGMLNGDPPEIDQRERQPIKIKDVRLFIIPVAASRMLRYQVGRFAELEHTSSRETRYLLTTRSLQKAGAQDLHLNQLLQLLEKEQAGVVPMALRTMEERWSRKGEEAVFEKAILLRFVESAACDELLKAAGKRFKLEVLNPRTILIEERQAEGITRLLNELGILVDRTGDV